jgi:hypothetical protein
MYIYIYIFINMYFFKMCVCLSRRLRIPRPGKVSHLVRCALLVRARTRMHVRARACVRLCVLTYAFNRVRECVAALCPRTWLQAPLLWYEEGAEARPRVSLLRALVTVAPHLRRDLHHAGAWTFATSAPGSDVVCPGGARRDAARSADGPFRDRYDRA